MKMENFHIGRHSFTEGDKWYISAEIDVPGLGVVKIKDCITDETRNQIEQECIVALKQKMGQTP